MNRFDYRLFGHLIELIKDPDCKDRDSIIILLENRGYRVIHGRDRIRVYRVVSRKGV